MNKVEYLSIIKYNGKYMIYFSRVKKTIEYTSCEGWGMFDTFEECYDELVFKCTVFPQYKIEVNVLLKKITRNIKNK